MDYRHSFAISAIGMTFERARVDVSAMNLANANSVLEPNGNGYQPMRVIARNTQAGAVFSEMLEDPTETSFESNFSLESTGKSPRMVHEPGNPLANTKGFVAYPAVDVATEMVTMMSAMRSYEANVAAMNTARNLALKALEIGGGS